MQKYHSSLQIWLHSNLTRKCSKTQWKFSQISTLLINYCVKKQISVISQHRTHPLTFDYSMFYTEVVKKYFSAYFQWRNNTLVKEIMSFGQSSIRMISALSMRTSSTAKILHYFKQVCQGRNALLVIPKPLWTSVSNRKTSNKQHLPFIHFTLLVYPWGSRLLCVRVMDFQIHFILTQKDFLLYCYSVPKQILNSEKWMCYRNSQKCLNIHPHLPSMLSCRKLFFGFL